LDALKIISINFLCEDNEVESQITDKIVTPQVADGQKDLFAGIFNTAPSAKEINNEKAIKAALKYKKTEEIKEEIRKLTNKITADNFAHSNLSSNKFWMENKIPNLSTLFIILESINSSSEFIERFFSFCGIILTKGNKIQI
jgi:hypothetical protein